MDSLTTYTYSRKPTVGGSYSHYVRNQSGETIGWISEVFPDVYYVQPAGRLYKDTRRYRTIEDALASPEWANAKVIGRDDK